MSEELQVLANSLARTRNSEPLCPYAVNDGCQIFQNHRLYIETQFYMEKMYMEMKNIKLDCLEQEPKLRTTPPHRKGLWWGRDSTASAQGAKTETH